MPPYYIGSYNEKYFTSQARAERHVIRKLFLLTPRPHGLTVPRAPFPSIALFPSLTLQPLVSISEIINFFSFFSPRHATRPRDVFTTDVTLASPSLSIEYYTRLPRN